jgi:hypothetical protein
VRLGPAVAFEGVEHEYGGDDCAGASGRDESALDPDADPGSASTPPSGLAPPGVHSHARIGPSSRYPRGARWVRAATKAAQEVMDGTARLRGAMTAAEEAGENLRMVTGTIRAVFGSRLIPIAGLLAGVRAGTKFLWRQYTRRRVPS